MYNIGEIRKKTKYEGNTDLESLDFYISLAEKMIKSNVKDNDLRYSMLRNDDAIAFMADGLITADYVYDNKKMKSRDSLRINYFKWRLCDWVEKSKTRANRPSASLDKEIVEDVTFYDTIPSNSGTPLDDMISDELRKDLMEGIDKLNQREQDCIRMKYFDNMTMNEISSKLNINENLVSQTIKNGQEKLRGLLDESKYKI